MIKIPKKRFFGHIYLATNSINGKVYVGQTRRERWEEYQKPIRERWKEHLKEAERYRKDLNSTKTGGSRYLNHAIQKYGPKVWDIRKIDTAYSLSELNEKEDYWVKEYDSANPNKGYNLREGGDGSLVNPETIEKLREANKRQFSDPQNIEKHSEISKKIWEKDEYRMKQDIARNSTEFKEKMRNARYRDWSKPEYRKHMENIMKSGEYKGKQRESQEKRWNAPGAKDTQSKRAESQWNNSEIKEKHLKARMDPEYKKRQSKAMKGNRNAYKEITNKKEFLNDIKNKMPLKEIAQKYDMSGTTVNERIKETLESFGVKNYSEAKNYLQDQNINNILKNIEELNKENPNDNQVSKSDLENISNDLREEHEDNEINKETSEEKNQIEESLKEDNEQIKEDLVNISGENSEREFGNHTNFESPVNLDEFKDWEQPGLINIDSESVYDWIEDSFEKESNDLKGIIEGEETEDYKGTDEKYRRREYGGET